MHVTDEMYAVG